MLTRLITFLLFAALTAPAHTQTIDVTPTGPIRTLTQARDAARAQRLSGTTGTITITIHAGTYFLTEPLTLGPEDSNTTWQVPHGEHPIISGGRPITGWTNTSGNIWTADAPGPYFRQLFVNDHRATRARTPNTGAFFRFEGGGTPNTPLRLHTREGDIQPQWVNQPDTEIVGFLAWSDFRSPILSMDSQTHLLQLAPTQTGDEENARYYIENAPDALDAPGEWSLDRATQKLSYIPQPGEDPTQAEVIAPSLRQLIILQGNPSSGELVQNVTFRGLTFEHADWREGPRGFYDAQAGISAPSAVRAIGTTNLHIERCTFAHLGGYAIELSRGSKHNQITANDLYDLGAGGIKIGEPTQRPDPADENTYNIIADNHIHDLGQVYAAGVGIWVLQSSRNQILHNHIHDLNYTAISVGWTWGYGPSQSSENLIAFNHLHDIGRDMLSDMGGIYTLGIQPGTVIRNNLIHDISAFTYGGWGIYFDEGSSNILAEDNIVYHCKSSSFHQHYGQQNIVRNNIFAFNREHQLMRTKGEPHLSFTLEANIVYFDQGDLLGGNWTDGTFATHNNLYYDTRTKNILFAGKSFSDWKSSGQNQDHDQNSRIADPLFINPAGFDFHLKPKSPALSMGFHPIDLSTIGPREPTGAATW